MRLAVAILLTGTALLYSPSLDHPFQYDDGHTIVDHVALREAGAWRAAFAGNSLSSAEIAGGHYRPLTHLSYWITIQVAGVSPRAFHVGNLLLHLVAVWLVIRVVTALAADPRIGLAAGALFAVHPALSEAVFYASARAGLLATVFSLAALSAFIRARRRSDEDRSTRWSWAAFAVFAMAALLSKETAVALPLLCLAADGLLLRPSQPALGRGRWIVYVAAGLGLVVFAALTGLWRSLLMVGFDSISRSLGTIAQQWPAIGLAMRLFLWPWPLTVDHVLPEWPSGDAVFLAVLPVGLIAVALLAGRSRSTTARAAAFFAWWVVIASLPTVVWPLNVPFQEHRAYGPAVGLVALAAIGIVSGIGAGRGFGKAPLALGVLLVGLYSWQVVERGRLWGDPVRLWENARAVAPASYRAQAHTGLALAASGRWDEAEGALVAALTKNPNYPPALVGHGVIAHRRGDYALARERYLRALDVAPNYVPAVYNLGLVAHQDGDIVEAERRYRQALAINPSHRESLMNLRAIEAARGAGAGRR